MTMQQDLDNRSPGINWPPEFQPENAEYFSHNTVFIAAPPARVWEDFVAASRWPEWYPNCKRLTIGDDGAVNLSLGATFTWTTFAMDVVGRVVEFESEQRVSWLGYGANSEPSFYHAWLFEPKAGGCQATYDEVGMGAVAVRMRAQDEDEMHRGHEFMLAGLRWLSETPRNG